MAATGVATELVASFDVIMRVGACVNVGAWVRGCVLAIYAEHIKHSSSSTAAAAPFLSTVNWMASAAAFVRK